LVHVYQDHGNEIHLVRRCHQGAGALTGEDPVGVGDGMITEESALPLAVLVADCLSLFFADRDGAFIGLAHAGWRGTRLHVASRMVERLVSEFGGDPSRLMVWIGPGISRCCFQVGEEVWRRFEEDRSRFPECFEEDTRKIDLKELNRRQLVSAGIPAHNIDVSPECTCCDQRFFSYRREGPGSGLKMAVIQRGG